MKNQVKREALEWLINWGTDNPSRMKSIHIGDEVINVINFGKIDIDEAITKDVWVSNQVIKKITDSPFFDIIKKNFVKTNNEAVDCDIYTVMVENENNKRSRPVDLFVTDHARMRFLQRALVVLVNDQCHYDISASTIQMFKENQAFMSETLKNKEYTLKHNPDIAKKIDKMIISFLRNGKIKSIKKMGNDRSKRKYSQRERNHGKGTLRVVANPFMFIIESHSKALTTIELYSSSYNYRTMNSWSIGRTLFKVKVNELKGNK